MLNIKKKGFFTVDLRLRLFDTVADISTDKPIRAVAEDKMGNSVGVVSSILPRKLNGRFWAFCGFKTSGQSRKQAYSLLISEHYPSFLRLQTQLKEGAVIVSYGRDFDIAERPIMNTWLNAGIDTPLEAIPLNGSTGISLASESDDENITWLSSLIEDISSDNSSGEVNSKIFALLDPLAFLPIPAQPPELAPGSPDEHIEEAARLYAEIRLSQAANRLRHSAVEHKDIELASYSTTDNEMSGSGLDWGDEDKEIGTAKNAHILPLYSRYESYTTCCKYWSGLSMRGFAPKSLPPTRHSSSLEMARDLGLALAADYGFDDTEMLSAQNARQSFADIFALLAIMRRFGDIEIAKNFVDLRHGFSLIGNPRGATGRACSEAYDRAKELIKCGAFSAKSTQDLLDMAADIASVEHLRPREIDALTEQRNKVYDFCDIKSMFEHVQDPSGGLQAYEAIKRAVAVKVMLEPRVIEIMARAIKGIESAYVPPLELDREATRKEALNLYREDLTQSFIAFKNNPNLHIISLDGEIKAQADEQTATEFMMRLMPFLRGDASLPSGRAAIIKRLMAGIDADTSPIKPQFTTLDKKAYGQHIPYFGSHYLRAAMEIAPKKRLSALVETSKTAIEVIESTLKNIGQNKGQNEKIYLNSARKALARRDTIAFAIFAHRELFKKLKSANPIAATEIINSTASGREVLREDNLQEIRIMLIKGINNLTRSKRSTAPLDL